MPPPRNEFTVQVAQAHLNAAQQEMQIFAGIHVHVIIKF